MLVLTIPTLCDVARNARTRPVINTKERQFPTTLSGPRATGSTRFADSLSWGAGSPSVHVRCDFVEALA